MNSDVEPAVGLVFNVPYFGGAVMVYVSVVKIGRTVSLRVDYSGINNKRYPLTMQGCIDAGKDLYRENVETWFCASSADRPREFKPGFRHNVRELLQKGYNQSMLEVDISRIELLEAIVSWCATPEFRESLSPACREVFKEYVAGVKHSRREINKALKKNK